MRGIYLPAPAAERHSGPSRHFDDGQVHEARKNVPDPYHVQADDAGVRVHVRAAHVKLPLLPLRSDASAVMADLDVGQDFVVH